MKLHESTFVEFIIHGFLDSPPPNKSLIFYFLHFAESSDPWAQSDRDYTYDELLQRVFGIMRDKNPEMVAGEKKKFVMRPPQVVRVGTKKTAFVNFTEIAKM